MTPTLVLLILTPLLVWRIYSRLKRLMLRQPSLLWRHWLGATALPVATVIVAVNALPNMLGLAILSLCVSAGAWLSVSGLRLTRFEHVGKEFFFTPNRRLGLLIAMLFVARLMYRGFEVYVNYSEGVPTPQDFANNPITLAAFGLLAGYFTGYSVGLVRWRRANRDPSIER